MSATEIGSLEIVAIFGGGLIGMICLIVLSWFIARAVRIYQSLLYFTGECPGCDKSPNGNIPKCHRSVT